MTGYSNAAPGGSSWKTMVFVVVVGIDGSKQSGEALRWAARYVTLHGGILRPVAVWDQTPGFGYFPGGIESIEREAHLTLSTRSTST